MLLPDGGDTVTGGMGVDTVDYAFRSGAITVTLADDTANDGESGEQDTIKSDVENVTGGSGNDDTLTGNGLANRLHGGAPSFFGGNSGGDDSLSGLDGADRLIGGNGAVFGMGDGTDTFAGGAGDDTISAQDGAVDSVDCAAGIDVATTDAAPSTPVDTPVTDCEFVNSASFSQPTPPGGTVNSDGQGGDAPGVSPGDPVDVAITSPNGGNVTVVEAEQVTGTMTAPDGTEFLDLQVNITAPEATLADPLKLAFKIDASLVPAGGAAAIKVTRDGTVLDESCPTPTTASQNGCVLERTTDANGDVTLVILTAHASAWNFAAAGIAPRTLGRSPATLAFGDQAIGGGPTAFQESTVTNTGNRSVTLTSLPFSGAGAADFERVTGAASDCTVGRTLAPTQLCNVRVRFDPTTSGAKTATLTVNSNAPAITVALTGTGTTASTGGGGTGGSGGGTPTTPSTPGPTIPVIPGKPTVPAKPKDTVKPTITLRSVKGQSLASVLRSGLKTKVTCSEACTVRAQIRLDAKAAKKLGLKGAIGTVTTKLAAKGTKTITVRLSSKARAKLRKRGAKITVSLRISAADTAGNKRTAPASKVALERR